MSDKPSAIETACRLVSDARLDYHSNPRLVENIAVELRAARDEADGEIRRLTEENERLWESVIPEGFGGAVADIRAQAKAAGREEVIQVAVQMFGGPDLFTEDDLREELKLHDELRRRRAEEAEREGEG